MQHFALIGCPLGHSLSVPIHRALLRRAGIDGDYFLKEIAPEKLKQAMDELRQLDGFNVTIPHKVSILPFLSGKSEKAELFGAVNTVKVENGRLYGDNTDCLGFLKGLELAGMALGGKVLLCGAGGAARMAAFEAVLAGADLTIAARNRQKAEALAAEVQEKLHTQVRTAALNGAEGAFDLIVNATPCGMFPHTDDCPLDETVIRRAGCVFDMIYNPQETRLLAAARRAGAKTANGLTMLAGQAAAAETIWNGTVFTGDDILAAAAAAGKELEKK